MRRSTRPIRPHRPWAPGRSSSGERKQPERSRPVLGWAARSSPAASGTRGTPPATRRPARPRSEEHTSELQSHVNLVCRLLLEKKKKKKNKQAEQNTKNTKK